MADKPTRKPSAPLPWFRMYHDVLHDPKVQQLTPLMFKYWVNLLCLASRQKLRGTLPPLRDIVFELRIETPPRDARNVTQFAQAMIDAFVALELLDDQGDHYTIHNWHGRQFESDNSSARVVAMRERERARKIAALQDIPPLDPFDDDSNVTPDDARNVTRNAKNALHVTPPDTETDTDADTDTDGVFVPNTQRATSRAARAKATKPKPKKCPAVTELIASVEKWAEGKGYTAPAVALQAERFANYCIANGKTYKDYPRALQNWITSPYNNAAQATGGGRAARLDTNDAADEAIRRLRARRGATPPVADYADAIDVPFSAAHGVEIGPNGQR